MRTAHYRGASLPFKFVLFGSRLRCIMSDRGAMSTGLSYTQPPHYPLSYRNTSMTVLQTIYWQPTPP